MPPLTRLSEICVYSLLNILPFLILALYPFRNNLRFSRRVTAVLICVLSVVQVFLGVWAALFSSGRAGLISAVSTALYTAFYFLSVNVAWGKALFTLLMISNTANLVVVGSKCIEGLIFPSLAAEPYRWSFSLVTAAVELIVLTPIFVYVKRVYTPAVEKEPSGFEWRYLWLIPATFYLLWYYEIYANKSQSGLDFALEPRNAVFLLLINAGASLIYYVVARLINEQNKNLRLSEQNHTLVMREVQYDNLMDRISEARRAKHDVRHHAAFMQELLRKQDYSALSDYLGEYVRTLPDDTPLVFCVNQAANAVISYFASLSNSAGIEYNVSAVIGDDIGIDNTDLSVILGNLIENAYDACLSEGGGFISVRASYDAHSLCIAVDNSFSGRVERTSGGAFVSSKHSGYGLGINSVVNIAEKYNGVCDFNCDGTVFRASVMMDDL